MRLRGSGSLWGLWFISFLSMLIFAVKVFVPSKSSPDSGAYLFAGLVGLMAFGNQHEISRKVAKLEEQARTARHSSS